MYASLRIFVQRRIERRSAVERVERESREKSKRCKSRKGENLLRKVLQRRDRAAASWSLRSS